MLDLPLQTLVFVWAGAFAGGLASGAAGFAFGIVAAAVWLHVIDPLHTTMLVVSGGMLLQFGTIWPLRHAMEWNRLWPFLIPGAIGIPLGVALLVYIDASALKVALGVFLVIYGAYALLTPRLPVIAAGGRAADATVGFAGGILGGLGGLSGVLPAIWCQLRGWPRDTGRAVYQPFIVMAHVLTLALIGVVALDRRGLLLFAAMLPALVAGGLVGWTIYGKLDERRFRQALAVLLVASGVLLVL